MEMWRQGDVLIVRVESVPEAPKEEPREHGRVVLAHGEATGHSHAVLEPGASIVRTEADERFLTIPPGGASVVHEEHDAIHLPEGVYKIVRQREYKPDGSRWVSD